MRFRQVETAGLLCTGSWGTFLSGGDIPAVMGTSEKPAQKT